MSKGKSNGNGKGQSLEAVLNTKELKEYEEFVHTPDSTEKAFRGQDTLNAIRLLVLSDPEFLDNTMRYDLPSSAVILAVALSISRCTQHNYQDGVEFWKLVCGLMTSKRGKRISQLVEAIIGERKWNENQAGSGGIGDKMKAFANKITG